MTQIAAVMLAFMLPCACYIKACQYQLFFWREQPSLRCRAFRALFFPVIVFIIGVILMIVGSTYTVLQQYNISFSDIF